MEKSVDGEAESLPEDEETGPNTDSERASKVAAIRSEETVEEEEEEEEEEEDDSACACVCVSMRDCGRLRPSLGELTSLECLSLVVDATSSDTLASCGRTFDAEWMDPLRRFRRGALPDDESLFPFLVCEALCFSRVTPASVCEKATFGC
jgi:hypothetical protein